MLQSSVNTSTLAKNTSKEATRLAALLLPLVATRQGASQTAHTERVEDPVETQGAEKAVDDAAEAEAVQKTADQVQDTRQQETDSGEDLAQRLCEKSPERVKLLLGVGHVLDHVLCVVDARSHGAGQLYITRNR